MEIYFPRLGITIGAVGSWFIAFYILRWASAKADPDRPSTSHLYTNRRQFSLAIASAVMLLLFACGQGYLLLTETETDIEAKIDRIILGVFGIPITSLFAFGALWHAYRARSRWAERDEQFVTIHIGSGPARKYDWERVVSLDALRWNYAWRITFDDGYKFRFTPIEVVGGDEFLMACIRSQRKGHDIGSASI